MATIADRIRDFLRSPRGQRLVQQGRTQLQKPENQRRLQQLANRLRSRGR
ncbi:hypothetical protein [Asanoa siamensis]|uniref:Uncharacterized protein n=1 Tax=Asanoa siamensis TaxID=926357 RepID=A0ABQ4D1I8_9ACTN|nr:hypothetical protein [Asanoa siamensis]GIF77380.1 hypothetical protein Asi02nite_68980 [Asanoa siamensis]